jgi:hypothetical protein
MDLMRDLNAAKKNVESSLAAERSRLAENIRSLHCASGKHRPRPSRLIESSEPIGSFESALMEKLPDTSVVKVKPVSRWRRFRTWLRKWWYAARKTDTHRFDRASTVKVFDHIPTQVSELFEEDEWGKPIDKAELRFTKVEVEAGTTCRLIRIFFMGLLLVELGKERYAVVGLDDLAKL